MKPIEVKVRYVKQTENGKKKVTENYLVDAMSFTEAEARITKEMKDFGLDEFSVETVRKSSYADLYLNYVDGKYYKTKVMNTDINDKTGVPTRTKEYYLIEAKSIMDAVSNAQRMIKGSVYDTEITEVAEMNIIDVITE